MFGAAPLDDAVAELEVEAVYWLQWVVRHGAISGWGP